MTDEELRIANARLKLENKYLEEYKKRYPKRVSKGQQFVEKSLEKLGNAAVSSMEDYIKNAGKSNSSNQQKTGNKQKEKNKSKKSKGSTRTEELNNRIKMLNGGGS